MWPNEYEKSLLAASRDITQNIAANDEADHSNNTNNDKVQDEATAASDEANNKDNNKIQDKATAAEDEVNKKANNKAAKDEAKTLKRKARFQRKSNSKQQARPHSKLHDEMNFHE